MKITWSPRALDQLDAIVEYIAADSPSRAIKFYSQLLRRVRTLLMFPRSGRRPLEVDQHDIRQIFFKNYRIVYQLNQREIAVLAVRNTRQRLQWGEIARARDTFVQEGPPGGLVM